MHESFQLTLYGVLIILGRESVLEHLVRKIECRGIFSTHYHRLAVDYEKDPKV